MSILCAASRQKITICWRIRHNENHLSKDGGLNDITSVVKKESMLEEYQWTIYTVRQNKEKVF